ncbi:unannotated protein [freshwater metagenome]|uniref:Unannotated protein n=1 Tax=freshwater metagenome TaxID=449393 RepID=A0A6J6GAS4_9ZZZZ|nr:uridine diphosphate-N-acetylglucosamine-binding protein YvcK [Actinomycetota bacterium]
MSSGLKIVALGGGHGLAATLTALRSITTQITAVVTVADNGGSSGRLRDEFAIMPPGDLRMALAALCADDEWGRNWAEIMQYRFTSEGELNGHALGNLLLAALWDRDQDSVAGLDQVGALLKVVGRVLPMSSEPLDIEATFELDGELMEAHGQVAVATTRGRLQSLRLIPSDPATRPEVIQAIMEADWITMGPGSWFSSVLPHLLVPTLRDAIVASSAKKILILNLDSATGEGDIGEFAGYSPTEHCEILSNYAPGLHFDVVLTDSQLEDKGELAAYLYERESIHIERDLRDAQIRIHHGSEKLASAFAHIAREILV